MRGNIMVLSLMPEYSHCGGYDDPPPIASEEEEAGRVRSYMEHGGWGQSRLYNSLPMSCPDHAARLAGQGDGGDFGKSCVVYGALYEDNAVKQLSGVKMRAPTKKELLYHLRELIATELMSRAGPSPLGKCDWDEGSRLADLIMPIIENFLAQPESRSLFACIGITALIDEATGYQSVRPKDALMDIAKKGKRRA